MALAGEVTDLDSITTEVVQLGAFDAYVAAPAGGGPSPGLLVIEEAFGRVEHIEDLCRRFAAAGFVAAAPELYARTGIPEPGNMEDTLAKMFGLPDAQIVSDCEAVAEYLRGRDDTTDKVGVIGFCMGGRATMLNAFSSEAFDAAVPCWGGFINRATFDDDTTDARPVAVADLADGLECPMLIVGGGDDENPSPDELQGVHDSLVELGKDVRLSIYDGAGHAFFADYRPSYAESQAFAFWDEIVPFLHGALD